MCVPEGQFGTTSLEGHPRILGSVLCRENSQALGLEEFLSLWKEPGRLNKEVRIHNYGLWSAT